MTTTDKKAKKESVIARLRKRLGRGAKSFAKALGGAVPAQTAEVGKSTPVIETAKQKLADAERGGMLKPLPSHHRIIAGMGSGDSSDVNTYALAGDKKFSARDRMTYLTGDVAAKAMAGGGEDGRTIPISGDAVGDVLRRAYIDDGKGNRIPNPETTKSAEEHRKAMVAKGPHTAKQG